MGGWVGVGGKMNPRIRLTSAKIEVGVEVEAELGKTHNFHKSDLLQWSYNFVSYDRIDHNLQRQFYINFP